MEDQHIFFLLQQILCYTTGNFSFFCHNPSVDNHLSNHDNIQIYKAMEHTFLLQKFFLDHNEYILDLCTSSSCNLLCGCESILLGMGGRHTFLRVLWIHEHTSNNHACYLCNHLKDNCRENLF